MSLFDQINEKKAVFFEDYISFDDNSFSVEPLADSRKQPII